MARAKKKTKTDSPDPIDVYVGKQIRKYRLLRDMSQHDLASGIGVEFQQVQKYETGYNRVSASRIVKIADTLNTTVPVLFGKYGTNQLDDALFDKRQVLKLIRTWNNLPADIRESTYKLIMGMGRFSVK